jgi:hypothetical protein
MQVYTSVQINHPDYINYDLNLSMMVVRTNVLPRLLE